MSQSYPPPQQPQQPQQPYGAPLPQYGAPTAAPASTGNPGLGILAGVVVMLVVAGIYGAILKATDGATIGYAALIIGALIGAAMGKVGGRSAALPVIAAILGLAGLYLGSIFGYALLISASPEGPHLSVVDVLFKNFDLVNTVWKKLLEPVDALFFVLAAAGGFSAAKKTAD
ncbi:hypothetical protein [Streptomyces chattanoogensis]|uniref:Uncharacterized protein n=1 Tax=Streptomyces chattanoogensis TaxID=66876 RepID=A0A0N0XU87_9ACTN|nr:hypothetical protein [Streptomyces chattanoogensis]KPC62236.1 hypothetical protein ADL29_20965 [Streptomyces chattanoogensis]